MKVINFFGGPGIGKSTTAAYIFSKLKQNDYNTELVTEYIKDKVWEQHFALIDKQIYIFAKQHHRLDRVKTQVDVAVTDSPLILSILYYKDCLQYFPLLVREVWNTFDNINIVLKRDKKYKQIGRTQTEEESIQLDRDLVTLLNVYNIDYVEFGSNDLDGIYNYIINQIGGNCEISI